MKIKGPRSKLQISEILDEVGLATLVRLSTGDEIYLPTSQVDFQVEDDGSRVAVIPVWLKKKVMIELKGEDPVDRKQSKIPF